MTLSIILLVKKCSFDLIFRPCLQESQPAYHDHMHKKCSQSEERGGNRWPIRGVITVYLRAHMTSKRHHKMPRIPKQEVITELEHDLAGKNTRYSIIQINYAKLAHVSWRDKQPAECLPPQLLCGFCVIAERSHYRGKWILWNMTKIFWEGAVIPQTVEGWY